MCKTSVTVSVCCAARRPLHSVKLSMLSHALTYSYAWEQPLVVAVAPTTVAIILCYPYTVGYHRISQQPHTIAYHINMTEDDRVTDLNLTFARKRQMGGEEGG
eukprot:scaffold100262_cov54-Attheya_sp.AAC.1